MNELLLDVASVILSIVCLALSWKAVDLLFERGEDTVPNWVYFSCSLLVMGVFLLLSEFLPQGVFKQLMSRTVAPSLMVIVIFTLMNRSGSRTEAIERCKEAIAVLRGQQIVKNKNFYGFYIGEADELVRNLAKSSGQATEEPAEQLREHISRIHDEMNAALREKQKMEETLANANIFYIATEKVRSRIEVQSQKADRLHDAAVRRTVAFQYLGIIVIAAGLAIVGASAYRVVFSDLPTERMAFVAPVAGVVFNLVGGGLILFHRTASYTALQYYDRKQSLDNLLTALELITNSVMRERTIELVPGLISRLYGTSASAESTDPRKDFGPASKP